MLTLRDIFGYWLLCLIRSCVVNIQVRVDGRDKVGDDHQSVEITRATIKLAHLCSLCTQSDWPRMVPYKLVAYAGVW